jgi:hypothetical protein
MGFTKEELKQMSPDCAHRFFSYPKERTWDFMVTCLECKLTVNQTTKEIVQNGSKELDKHLQEFEDKQALQNGESGD